MQVNVSQVRGYEDFAAWREHGHILAQGHSNHQFEIAKWMLAGEEVFGDHNPYDVAEDITGYARLTLQNWVSVVRHVSIRIESLSFGHHQVVASLEPEQQREWLERAAAEQLSVKKLMAAIQESRAAIVQGDSTEPSEETSPVRKKPLTADQLHRALSFVPAPERDNLMWLSLARGISQEELIVQAIGYLSASAADEINRQKELSATQSLTRVRAYNRWLRRDYERRGSLASTRRLNKEQAEHAARCEKVEALVAVEKLALEEARSKGYAAKAELDAANAELRTAELAEAAAMLQRNADATEANVATLAAAHEATLAAKKVKRARQLVFDDAKAAFKKAEAAHSAATNAAWEHVEREEKEQKASQEPASDMSARNPHK